MPTDKTQKSHGSIDLRTLMSKQICWLGMNSDKLYTLIEREALDQFDATKDTYLVLKDNALALEDDFGVVVRCFVKKSQKTASKEKDVARERMKDYLARHPDRK